MARSRPRQPTTGRNAPDRAKPKRSRSARSRVTAQRRAADHRAGWQFLAVSSLGALNTINARKPFAREGAVSVPSFFSGWLTSELPLHAIGWQVLATAVWAKRGALRSPAGIAAMGVNIASWVALTKVWDQAMGQKRVYDDALREALGEAATAGADPIENPETDHSDATRATPAGAVAAIGTASGAGGGSSAVAHGQGAEPTVTRRRIVRGPLTPWKRDYVNGPAISYGEAGRRNTLDVWRHPDLPADAGAPVLLQVHGGGWMIGNKDQQAMPLMAHLADQGWVCVSINYRLSPRATWPDHIVDVKRALAWTKQNIDRFGGDPRFVAITGGSAGGHLSSLAALTPNVAEFQPGFEEVDTSVAAAVPFYGVYDFTNRDGTGRADMTQILSDFVLKSTPEQAPVLWDHASTMSWVNPDAPPFFVVHGTNDSLVPVEQARSFVRMLREVSRQPVAYAELPGAQHAFEVFDSPRTIYTAGAVHRFLEAIRTRDDSNGISIDNDPPPERINLGVLTDGPGPSGDASASGRIKGRVSSKKYHVPGSQWYDRTNADVWFDTVEEAVAAGYEPAGGASKQKLPPTA